MIHWVTRQNAHAYRSDLEEMFRLRHRVFKERLGWEVSSDGVREYDRFDDLHPDYLLCYDKNGHVTGCIRFVPMEGPNMLRDVFPVLMDDAPVPAPTDSWESSRFAVEQTEGSELGKSGLNLATCEIFAGVIEFGMARGLKSIITVTDVFVERIIRRSGWRAQRLGKPHKLGVARAVALELPTNREELNIIREWAGFNGPVIANSAEVARLAS